MKLKAQELRGEHLHDMGHETFVNDLVLSLKSNIIK